MGDLEPADAITMDDLDILTTYDLERGDLLTGEELSEFADVDMNLSEVSPVCLLRTSVLLRLRTISSCKNNNVIVNTSIALKSLGPARPQKRTKTEP